MITKEEFEALTPFRRGYAAYMAGCREDEPNVPDERNPYPFGTFAHGDWVRGQTAAAIHAQDSEE